MSVNPGDLADNKTTPYKFQDLTPSDATEYPLDSGLKALYIKVGGRVDVTDHHGNTVSIADVPVNNYLYMRPKFVLAATTASVVGLFS